MEAFRESGDYESAIALCRDAIKESPTAIIGLPHVALARAQMIEYELSHLLQGATEPKLRNPSNAEAILDWLLGLSKQFQMKDWLVTHAMPLFRDVEMLPLYFRKIIESDPEATSFRYTADFAKELLNNCDGIELGRFLLSLRSRVAPIELLLQFALRPGQARFLFDIYMERLDDVIAAVSVLEDIGDFETVSKVICQELDPERTTRHDLDLVKWTLAPSGDSFPRMTKLIALGDVKVFYAIEEFILAHGQPVSLSTYVNIFVCLLDGLDLPPSGCMFKFVKMHIHGNSFRTEEKIRLGKRALAYVLKFIFAPVPERENDDRESLFLGLLEAGLEPEFMKALIPLCESFGFLSAKRLIQKEAKIYDSYIKDTLYDNQEDVFQMIEGLLGAGEATPAEFKRAIVTNSSLLIARDVQAYILMIFTHFLDFHNEILTALDDWVRHYYLRALFATKYGQGVILSESLACAYAAFLCDFFPDEVYPFMRSHDVYLFSDFVVVCADRGIFDACAYLSQKTSSTTELTRFLSEYIASNLLSFADGHPIDIDMKIEFVFSVLHNARFDHYNELAASLIHAFVVPIFSIINDSKRLEAMCGVLSRLCRFIANHLPFTSVLRLIIVELSDFPLGSETLIRSVILGIINDYDYDTQTTVTLTHLFRTNELAANREYATAALRGTRIEDPSCGTCGLRLAGTDLSLRAFQCGHVFHESCCTGQACHLCRALEVSGERKAPLASVNEREALRRFRKFEALLESGFGEEADTRSPEKRASIAVVRPPT
jgi:hypothetical protein